MRLSRDDQVAGIPATDARKLMRRFGDAQPESRIGSWIDTGSRTGTEVARAFADAGYLRVSAVYDAETYWETTIQGNALAQARFGRPITRATAGRHLTGVIGRAKKFNADGSHVIDIAELVVFGSYLDPDVQHLGDLDLGVTFCNRIPDTTATFDQSEILLDYARASGRRFRNSLYALSWPEQEALQILRNRSAVINITREDVRTLTDRWEVVYSYDGP
jgi:predicted nucleotidyltransferase